MLQILLKYRYITIITLPLLFLTTSVLGQNSYASAGGSIENESFQISYSIGQIFNQQAVGEDFILNEGVNVPYQIFEVNEEPTSNKEFDDIKFDIFPNPFVDEISLKTTSPNKLKARLFNLKGEELIDVFEFSFNAQFSLSNKPSGVYFIQVFNNDISRTFKIIKN